jgi:hypothetical protein
MPPKTEPEIWTVEQVNSAEPSDLLHYMADFTRADTAGSGGSPEEDEVGESLAAMFETARVESVRYGAGPAAAAVLRFARACAISAAMDEYR